MFPFYGMRDFHAWLKKSHFISVQYHFKNTRKESIYLFIYNAKVILQLSHTPSLFVHLKFITLFNMLLVALPRFVFDFSFSRPFKLLLRQRLFHEFDYIAGNVW